MCTLDKQDNIFLLTLTGDNPHWLNPDVIDSLLASLRKVRVQAKRGNVLITTSTGKFFSSGLDIAWAQSQDPRNFVSRLYHLVEMFRPVISELISLPMPTIAAVNGHALATGFLLAITHDYVLMRSDRGVFCMPEVDLGLSLPDYFAVMFREKIRAVWGRRNVLLKGGKIRAAEGGKIGIVDSAYDSEEQLREGMLRLGEELGKKKWSGEVYKEIRKSLYPEICEMFGLKVERVADPKL